jgi:hypothetical protein
MIKNFVGEWIDGFIGADKYVKLSGDELAIVNVVMAADMKFAGLVTGIPYDCWGSGGRDLANLFVSVSADEEDDEQGTGEDAAMLVFLCLPLVLDFDQWNGIKLGDDIAKKLGKKMGSHTSVMSCLVFWGAYHAFFTTTGSNTAQLDFLVSDHFECKDEFLWCVLVCLCACVLVCLCACVLVCLCACVLVLQAQGGLCVCVSVRFVTYTYDQPFLIYWV